MKKLLILGMLALGLSVAAPQAHSQVRVRVRTHERFVRPRAGFSINLGTPEYQRPVPYSSYKYQRPSYHYRYGDAGIINHQNDWRRNDDLRSSDELQRNRDWQRHQWMERHRFARMGPER